MHGFLIVSLIVFTAIVLCSIKAFGAARKRTAMAAPLTLKVLVVLSTWLSLVGLSATILLLSGFEIHSFHLLGRSVHEHSRLLLVTSVFSALMVVLTISLWGTLLRHRWSYYVAVSVLCILLAISIAAGFVPRSTQGDEDEAATAVPTALLLGLAVVNIARHRKNLLRTA